MYFRAVFCILVIVISYTVTESKPLKLAKCAEGDFQCKMCNFLEKLVSKAKNKVHVMNQNEVNVVTDRKWHSDHNMDVKCFACQESVDLARILFRKGEKDKAIQTLMTYICKLLYIETEVVCASIIPLFSKEVLYVFQRVLLTPEQICSLILNECGEWRDPYQVWNITLPDVPKPPPKHHNRPPKGAKTTRILQISDIHFDPRYQPGSWVVCNEPLCCRAESSKGAGDRKAGYWGDYGACDVPYWTVANMLDNIVKSHEFDYVYWTGDLPPHDVWQQTRTGMIDIYKNITSLFLKYFPNKPVFSALGNHESAPVNSFPPDYITGNMSISWLYEQLEESWTHWIPQSTSQNIKQGAYYTTLIEPGLRLISVNSNYCNNLNFWLLLNATDPNGELDWLAKTLQNSENIGEKVHIIGHIPPGHPDCLKAWSSNYYKIVNRYENTIAAQFYGHTHNDHFQLFYEEKEPNPPSDSKIRRPTGSVFISPSVTTFLNMNPGYRVYTVDGSRPNSTRMVLDHETYVASIAKANNASTPVWELEYSARHAFGLEGLFPRDLEELVTKLETDDVLFGRFLSFYYKGRPQACDEKCREDMICALRTGSSGDTSFC